MNEKASGSLNELIPVLILCLAIAVIACLPLRIMSYGFIPPDDAMRHAAKAISGKSWDQILVVRPEFKMDSHPGWHAILTAVHNVTGCDQDALILFSVVILFIIFALIPIFFLEHAEAWLATLLAVAVVSPGLIVRLFLGRPFILTMSTLLALFFLWPALKEKKMPLAVMGILTALIASSTWIHAGWYLFALPVICFFIAGELRSGLRFALCAIIGVSAGAAMTGHPILFFKQTITHMMLAFGNVSAQRLLVTEFRPFNGDGMAAMLVLIILIWRRPYLKRHGKPLFSPVFILAAAGWTLGFVATRFWTDWGMPAAIFWIATEIDSAMSEHFDLVSWSRAGLALAISAALFLSVSADIGGRWTNNLTTEYLSVGDSSQTEWLPEPGGIIYSSDMGVFYQTFFRNPKAEWRYILGFEPAMMPPEDLAIMRKIQWNSEAYQAFEPWVKKMRPQDRLVVGGAYNAKPNMPGLEWHYAATGTWVGRTPKR